MNYKPKILKGYIPQKQMIYKDASEFTLGLDQKLFTATPIPRLIKSEKPVKKTNKQYIEPFESKDIKVEEFREEIPPKYEGDPITNIEIKYQEEEKQKLTYVDERERTKQFLVDVLAEEISRVDKRTYDLFEELQQYEKEVEIIVSNNEQMKKEVYELVKNRTNEEKLRILEDRLDLQAEYRYNYVPDIDDDNLYRQLQDHYQENEKLNKYTQEVMERLGLIQIDQQNSLISLQLNNSQ